MEERIPEDICEEDEEILSLEDEIEEVEVGVVTWELTEDTNEELNDCCVVDDDPRPSAR